MKNFRNAIMLVIVASNFEHAIASQIRSTGGHNFLSGSHYALTPEAARAMNIDLQGLKELVNLQNNQLLAFQIQEDGELDLSIYENGIFATLKSDLTK